MLSCVVLHSGGMDSSICLALAKKQYGAQRVVSLGFSYGQRHAVEMAAADTICQGWGITRTVLDASIVSQLTSNALVDPSLSIQIHEGIPSTMVVGRNGLLCWLASLWAYKHGVFRISTGIIELEEANSGYRDCSRAYMDRVQELLRMDFACPSFEIQSPLVKMNKLQTLELAHELGVLDELLCKTVTCYEGIKYWGCTHCPACSLRNQALRQYCAKNENYTLPSPYH